MQRKNRILKRRGMAMIMAIYMILIVGGIMAAVISMTSQSNKRTTDVYLHEQAMLLTRSATEYAMLAVSGHNHRPVADGGTNDCINRIDAQYPEAGANAMLDINITLRYIGFGTVGVAAGDCEDFIGTIQTPDSNGSILMDVVVTSNPGLNLTEPIRYHRRTLQKM